MRPIIGFLALLLTVALASPSVVVTSAADDPQQSQSCSAPDAETPVIRLDAAVRAEHLRALAEHQARAEHSNANAGEAEVVVLNNRGYNYGPAPRPELAPIELESAVSPSPAQHPSASTPPAR